MFATRAPTRPNRIDLSVLTLTNIIGNVLQIENSDILDGSPLLDIKPYVPKFDQPEGGIRTGWRQKDPVEVQAARSDQHFT